jgi:hypothetical protein
MPPAPDSAADSVPPPSDLDLPAALAAEAQYRVAVAGGAPEGAAWSGAVEVFRLHHPAWPLPLAELEAARLVGALIAARRGTAGSRPGANHATPPLHLLRRLARPARPAAAGAEPGEPPPTAA